MQIFDGFIAAIASEFNIKFHKTEEGSYTTRIEFEDDRSQEVLVMLSWDEAEDRMIHYYSVITSVQENDVNFYHFALELNSTLDYGALALLDNTLILRNSILLEDCEPKRFIKSLVYIAAKADELVEKIYESDFAD